MILSKSILILEDNLKVLSNLLEKLFVLEQDQPFDFALVILTTSKQVEDYVNNNPKAMFDIVIIDRDCKLGGSFHVIELNRFNINNIISISTVEEYNEDLKKKGVRRVVLKDLRDLDKFSEQVTKEVEQIIRSYKLA
ncbi:hypothetical protein B6D29_02055 [Microgenomates bacterium UTCPR1]|nr:MAG: hypothetical protein B6D29_02055 [Microgenomates bacterium UTCPR1]